jgi:acyl-CoA synthetase (AMP-forming)/AMP-acid ligase II
MKLRADKELQARWRADGHWRDQTLDQAFEIAARRHPEALLTVHATRGPRSISLGQLRDRGRALAGALHGLGLKAGDVVAMQMPNSIETALVYQAAAALGCVILPIVAIYGPHELGFVLRDARAKILFIPDRWRQTDCVQNVRDSGQLPDLKAVVVVGDGDAGDYMRWDDFEGLAATDNWPGVGADDPAFMVYTSGTTADPKGVLHSANSLLAEVWQSYPDNDPASRVMSPYPAGHVAGTLGVLAHAAAARRTILFETYDADAAARYVGSERITHTAGTPFHYLALLDAAEALGCDMGSLRACGTGGATVPESLVARAEAAGIHMFRRYGMSEHPTVTQGADGDPLYVRMTTDGRLRPGVEVRIVDDDGNDVETGTEGEVATRGPDMFLGYSDPSIDAGAWLPGCWFLSGDIGRLDAAGLLAITDRKKDIIIRGGENISSREVEDLLLRIPGVREAAAVGYPDDRLGERVCAYLIVDDDLAIDLAAIDAAFQAFGAARQKTPERVIFARDLPRTPVGKIRKAELRRDLREALS